MLRMRTPALVRIGAWELRDRLRGRPLVQSAARTRAARAVARSVLRRRHRVGWSPAAEIPRADTAWMPLRVLPDLAMAVWLQAPHPVGPDSPLAGTLWATDIDSLCTQEGPRPAFVFSTDFCGSTLLARCLHALPGVRGHREPGAVTDLAACDPRRYRPDFDAWLRGLVTLLGRGGDAVVKVPSTTNHLIERLVDISGRPAVFLHGRPEDYVASVLGDPWRRRYVAFHARRRLGATGGPAYAALAWWSEQVRRARRIARERPADLLPVTLEALLDAPVATLSSIVDFLALPASRADVAAVVDSGLLGAHAKYPDRPYGPAQRARRLAAVGTRHADAIRAAFARADEAGLIDDRSR